MSFMKFTTLGGYNFPRDIAAIPHTYHQFSPGQKSNSIGTTNTSMAENLHRKFDLANGNSRSNLFQLFSRKKVLACMRKYRSCFRIFYPPLWEQELALENVTGSPKGKQQIESKQGQQIPLYQLRVFVTLSAQ